MSSDSEIRSRLMQHTRCSAVSKEPRPVVYDHRETIQCTQAMAEHTAQPPAAVVAVWPATPMKVLAALTTPPASGREVCCECGDGRGSRVGGVGYRACYNARIHNTTTYHACHGLRHIAFPPAFVAITTRSVCTLEPQRTQCAHNRKNVANPFQ